MTKFTQMGAKSVVYDLPIIHKPNVPLKPILSASDVHNFTLAQELVDIMASLCTNEFSVRDCFTFASEIVTIKNADKYFMSSAGIENLFTNI